MATWKRINEKTLRAIKDNGEIADFEVVLGNHPVNETQYNLPVGRMIIYNDGSKIIHIKGYYLLRNWHYNNQTWDRIAIPDTNVYCVI